MEKSNQQTVKRPNRGYHKSMEYGGDGFHYFVTKDKKGKDVLRRTRLYARPKGHPNKVKPSFKPKHKTKRFRMNK